MSVRIAAPILMLGLAVAGCNPAHDTAPPATSAESSAAAQPQAAATPITATTLISCATEIGAVAADKRAAICRDVSPATHPPCNTANSCAMVEDEIARSCALFDDKDPMAGCGSPPKSQEAAVDVVRRYYSALNAHDYGTAWLQWGENGPPNQDLAKFTSGFAHTRTTRVTIGKLEPAEGGAGSIYQTVPVVVDATLDDGKQQRLKGEYIIRRVNGVDGATAAQLRWHIGSAHLTNAK